MLRNTLLPFLLFTLSVAAQTDTDAHLQQATAAYDAGDYELALLHADSAIARTDTSAKAYKLRGDIHQRLVHLDQAISDYKASEKLDPTDPRLYVSRGAARITGGNLKGGIRDLEKALELDDSDADAWYNLACAKYMGQDINGAMKDARRALRLRADFPDALFLSGVIKGEQYKEEDGLAEVQEALRLKPEIPGGRMSLAMLYYDTKRYKEAIDLFTAVIDGKDEGKAEAYYYRGDCYYELGDKEQACRNWRISADQGDREAVFIVKNYCETDEKKIPKKPVKKRKTTIIEF